MKKRKIESVVRNIHPLLPSCVQGAGPFSEIFLAEVLPTLAAWRPGSELVQEHSLLHALFSSVEDPGALLPQLIARALELLGHKPDFSAKPNIPFITRSNTNEAIAVVLVASFQEELRASSLLDSMREHKLSWGILTNGETWRLYHSEHPSPYEIEPLDLFHASFFSEPLRYFSLFFRASSFTSLLSEALSGSDAAESASRQALLLRASEARQLIASYSLDEAHLPRALFAITAAAIGVAPFAEIVQRVRAHEEDAALPLCSLPMPANAVSLDHIWLARLIQELTPEDPSDPSGLRDARLRGVSWFAPLVCEAMQGSRDALAQPFSVWVASTKKTNTKIFDITPEGPLHLSALLEQSIDAARCFSLSPTPWQAELARLTLFLFGVREERLLRQHRFGRLCIDSREQLLSAVRTQASLFESVTKVALARADVEQDRGWLTVLCDALAARQDNIASGFETLLSQIQTPAKLVAQFSVTLSHQWAREHGAFHWWLSSMANESDVLFFVSGLDAPIERIFSLCPDATIILRTSSSALKRPNGAALRRQVLQDSSLISILSLPQHTEFVSVRAKQKRSQDVAFVTASQTVMIPAENLLQHPGSPWTLLRQSRALSLAARIQARSVPMRELVFAAEPGQIFVSDEALSLQPVAGFLSYRLRDGSGEVLADERLSSANRDARPRFTRQSTLYHDQLYQMYSPAYVMACSLSSALRFVLLIDELSLLSLPIPRLRLVKGLREREMAMSVVRPLLLAGRPDALLSHVSQQLAHGNEELAHDLLAESARTGHCVDVLPQAIIGLLLGLSEEEASLIASVSAAPSLSFVAKPLPVHIPAVKVESEHREQLLAAFREKQTLTSHEAQGATGLDSRKLRQLLTDLELTGEITRTGRGSGTLYHLASRTSPR